MLEVTSASVFYGPVQALWDISYQVRAGQIVTLLGSNGAGKSTALKVANGLIRPLSGEVRFQGRVIHRLSTDEVVRQGLCLVPEERHLFPYMSVQENLELGAFTPEARRERKQTLEWIYRLFPALESRSHQRVHTLSGGEQQMVAVGRGLMARPRLLMMDEPCLGLAPFLVTQLFRAIARVNEHGLSILLV